MRPTDPLTRRAAAALLLIIAAVHVPLIPEHLEEAPYVGSAFIVLSIASIALAIAILYVDDLRVWVISAATCCVAMGAFLVSRTLGLPQLGDDIGNWTEPLSFSALGAELLLTLLAGAQIANAITHNNNPSDSAQTAT